MKPSFLVSLSNLRRTGNRGMFGAVCPQIFGDCAYVHGAMNRYGSPTCNLPSRTLPRSFSNWKHHSATNKRLGRLLALRTCKNVMSAYQSHVKPEGTAQSTLVSVSWQEMLEKREEQSSVAQGTLKPMVFVFFA